MKNWTKHLKKYVSTLFDKPYFLVTINQRDDGSIGFETIYNAVFIKNLDRLYISHGRQDYEIDMDERQKVMIHLIDILENSKEQLGMPEENNYYGEIEPMILHDKPVKTVFDLGTNKNWEVRG